MPRALFEKTGNAIYISHLDLMRVFQRAFKRAGLPLTHTQGFTPRPSVSIALPLSLGVESQCELLDFDLEGDPIPNAQVLEKLNAALIDGVRIREIYSEGGRIKDLALLECELRLEYDGGIPADAVEKLQTFFRRDEIFMEKKSKTGKVNQQNIMEMIKRLDVEAAHSQEIRVHAIVCCQNPSLNPMQITGAIAQYLPEVAPDFVRCRRLEIFDQNETIFR